jgi:hypothetical protein
LTGFASRGLTRRRCLVSLCRDSNIQHPPLIPLGGQKGARPVPGDHFAGPLRRVTGFLPDRQGLHPALVGLPPGARPDPAAGSPRVNSVRNPGPEFDRAGQGRLMSRYCRSAQPDPASIGIHPHLDSWGWVGTEHIQANWATASSGSRGFRCRGGCRRPIGAFLRDRGGRP